LSIFRLTPSSLNNLFKFTSRVRSSTLNTPVSPPLNGTAAQSKMLLTFLDCLRLVVGFIEYHQTKSPQPEGRFPKGVLGSDRVEIISLGNVLTFPCDLYTRNKMTFLKFFEADVFTCGISKWTSVVKLTKRW